VNLGVIGDIASPLEDQTTTGGVAGLVRQPSVIPTVVRAPARLPWSWNCEALGDAPEAIER
jgi:hypothetical protein